jgi:predicted Zn finger-like uncharacterized protein
MIVQCPRCSTRWRVEEPSATDNPVFKCGRCRHVFPRFPGAPATAERSTARAASTAPPAGDNLEFIFPRRASATPANDRVTTPEPPAAPLLEIVTSSPGAAENLVPATLPRRTNGTPSSHAAARSQAGGEAARPSTEGGPPSSRDPAGVASGPPRGSQADDAHDQLDAGHQLDASEDDFDLDDELGRSAPPAAARVLVVEDAMSAAASSPAFRPINRALLALVGVHAILALFIRLSPERAGDWCSRVPLIGTVLTDWPTLGREITLRNVQGGYQRLRNARRVFVISGEAVNNSLATIERIEVEGALYSGNGAVRRKAVSTGNKTTLKLADLSESEIAMLQRFDPRWTIAPGESASFSIVFLEPPRDLREFSSRVLTARPARRTPAGPSMDRALAPASVG